MIRKLLLYAIALTILLASCTGNEKKNLPNDALSSLSSLIPVVKKSSLSGKSFSFSGEWRIDVVSDSVVYNSLKDGLQGLIADGRISLNEKAGATIRFILKPGSVDVDQGIDTNKTSLEEQAYQLQLAPKEITITANAAQGLYYGVQTFLQLIQSQKGDISLPEGEIRDWPDLSLRMIYWDDAHHLEKFGALKRIILQASHYKINAFALKLEGHFQYSSAPAIIEPYALSPQQYQELTDFARAHFVELVPYLDAPAHISFILKHPEYSGIRLYPNNNYELSVIDPRSVTLMKNMFGDLLDANKGGKCVMLSTDEPYYIGKAPREINAAKEAGSNGKLLARFVKTIGDDLRARGRTPIFWGEFPLVVDDISSLPSYLVNGEYNTMASSFSRQGIRQMIYTSTQGEEPIFPNYYHINERDTSKGIGRVLGMLRDIRAGVADKKASLMGIIVAGWADAGLHPETFWLGYITGTAMGWNFDASNAEDLSKRFFNSFYGPLQTKMDTIYKLLSTQAEFYDQSWTWVRSNFRKPILGNSEGIFEKPEKAWDQEIPILPLPSAKDLSIRLNWDSLNKGRLDSVEIFRIENFESIQLLKENLAGDKQRYNLEVMTSIALLCRQNLDMFRILSNISSLLIQASGLAKQNQPQKAIDSIDEAIWMVGVLKKNRNAVLDSVSRTWYKEWEPLVKEANGRKFLFELDDIKDHRPARTIDLSYLIYRELNYPLGKWFDRVLTNRNQYARRHGLAMKNLKLEWGK